MFLLRVTKENEDGLRLKPYTVKSPTMLIPKILTFFRAQVVSVLYTRHLHRFQNLNDKLVISIIRRQSAGERESTQRGSQLFIVLRVMLQNSA